MSKAPFAATLSIAAIACCVWWIASDRGPRPQPRRATPGSSAATPHGEADPVPRPRAATDDVAAPPRASDPLAPDGPVVSAERVEAAVAALARELSSARYDPSLWTTHMRATARSLGLDAAVALRDLIAASECSAEACVAAAELLRVLQDTAARHLRPLDLNALAEIRARAVGRVGDDASVPPAVAMRALAAWGDELDRARLLELAFPLTPGDDDASTASQNALFALACSASADIALRLAERGTDRAFIALDGFESASGWSLTALDRLDIAARIDARLQDASADVTTRLRALAILERYDAEAARKRVDALVRDADAPERLVVEAAERLLRGGAGAQQVATALDALGTGNALSVAVACAPSLHATPDPLLTAGVLGVLTDAVRTSLDSSDRLRATNALGALGTIGSRTPLVDALRFDASAAVRAAAATALRAFGRDAVRDWTAASEADPSEAVRALCRHELARLGALPGDS